MQPAGTGVDVAAQQQLWDSINWKGGWLQPGTLPATAVCDSRHALQQQLRPECILTGFVGLHSCCSAQSVQAANNLLLLQA